MELKALTKQVYDVLRDYPETRNSDIELTLRVWREFHGVQDQIDPALLFDLPREDNVKRIRARIQNEDREFVPTEWKIAKARGFEEDKWRELLNLKPRKKVLDLR
jgi:hypothetical protein|tara:strand:+ start:204 stop:518 length:315 start_codon:yes stop_codon:yes gene_type:complete